VKQTAAKTPAKDLTSLQKKRIQAKE